MSKVRPHESPECRCVGCVEADVIAEVSTWVVPVVLTKIVDADQAMRTFSVQCTAHFEPSEAFMALLAGCEVDVYLGD